MKPGSISKKLSTILVGISSDFGLVGPLESSLQTLEMDGHR